MVNFYFLLTLLPKQSNTGRSHTGRSQGGGLPARSFDLSRPGVAPPLSVEPACHDVQSNGDCVRQVA